MRKYVFILFLLVVPLVGRAQFNFDFLSVEAMIDNHKSVRSVLTARSGVEQANELLHDYSQAAAVDCLTNTPSVLILLISSITVV